MQEICLALLLYFHLVPLCPQCVIILSWESSSTLDIFQDSYVMPPCEMQISPSPLKCNKINSSSSSRKSTILFLTVLQNLSMYLLLLSTGSELSDPNYISHFTDVQSFPPKIDMEELCPIHTPTPSPPHPQITNIGLM